MKELPDEVLEGEGLEEWWCLTREMPTPRAVARSATVVMPMRISVVERMVVV